MLRLTATEFIRDKTASRRVMD